jgi:hypothetical protein
MKLLLIPLALLVLAAAPAPQKPAEMSDAQKQKQTIADIRNLGTALFSWLTDQVGAAAAGEQEVEKPAPVNIQDYPPISKKELEKLLVPNYILKVPEYDGWGHPYEVRLNVKDVLAQRIMSIRSPGRDGVFATDVYEVSAFDPEDYDEDIVWNDGFFTHWPQKVR